MLGESGCGKSTLLNAMVNYLSGVSYEDKYRIKIVLDSSKTQLYSQTEKITKYTIIPNENIFPFPIKIIDTPGFLDTGGFDKDKEFNKKLFEFLKNDCDTLHAICFVAKASANRLLFNQKYVIENIMKIFGKDTSENFFALLNFADTRESNAIKIIEEEDLPIKNEDIFEFNNSAIFPDIKDKTIQDINKEKMKELIFECQYNNFSKFFNKLRSKIPASLDQTKEVIKSREQINTKIIAIQRIINNAICLKSRIEKENEIFKEHRKDIENGRSFKYKLEKSLYEKKYVENGKFATICTNCNSFLCHNDCIIKDNMDKYLCCTMNMREILGKYNSIFSFGDNCDNQRIYIGPSDLTRSSENNPKLKRVPDSDLDKICCSSCIGNCNWKVHQNLGYYYEVCTKEVEKTYNPQKKISDGYDGKTRSITDEIIDEKYSEIRNLGNLIINAIQIVQNFFRQLNVMALKNKKFDDLSEIKNYLDKMIDRENKERKPGYENRIL